MTKPILKGLWRVDLAPFSKHITEILALLLLLLLALHPVSSAQLVTGAS